jgi:hypothetical protein
MILNPVTWGKEVKTLQYSQVFIEARITNERTVASTKEIIEIS